MNIKTLKTFIPDTNVLLNDSSSVFKFQEHNVVILIQVIEELDTFKKGVESINFHAREFTRFLDEKSSNQIFNGGISLGEGLGTIRIQLACPFDRFIKKNLKNQTVDAEIINAAYMLQKMSEYKDTQVIIVSKDVNLRMKAKALGIMAQDYLTDAVVNIDTVFEGIKTLEVNQNIISKIYKRESEPFVEMPLEDAHENQSFILKNGKSSALAIYKKGCMHKVIKERTHAFHIKPKNAEQIFTMHNELDPKISLMTIGGKAGTGKTIISLACGLQQIADGIYDQLLFTRQTVSLGDREIGFLPGNVDDKIAPFMNGINDNLAIIIEQSPNNKKMIDDFKKAQKFMMEPLPYIRGRSLHKAFFVIDEAQNLTPHEVKTIVTRAGEGTKMIFIGDVYQIDNPYLDQRSNGLSYLIDRFKGQECYSHINLEKGERSPLAELAGNLL